MAEEMIREWSETVCEGGTDLFFAVQWPIQTHRQVVDLVFRSHQCKSIGISSYFTWLSSEKSPNYCIMALKLHSSILSSQMFSNLWWYLPGTSKSSETDRHKHLTVSVVPLPSPGGCKETHFFPHSTAVSIHCSVYMETKKVPFIYLFIYVWFM